MAALAGGGDLGNVLVATDFVGHARDAVARAAFLPIGRGEALTLLHVLPPHLPPAQAAEVRAIAGSLLQGVAATAAAERERAERPAVDVFPVLAEGRVAVTVAARARDERAELVVVGRGAPRGLRERLIGATAERIVRAAACSVLVVSAAPDGAYRRPLVAVDLSPVGRRAVALAARLVAPATSGLDVVLAYNVPYYFELPGANDSVDALGRLADEEAVAARRQLEAWIAEHADLGVPLRPCVRRGEAAAAVCAEAAARGADLVVIGATGHSAVAPLLLGGVAERILRRAPCDVLAVR